MGHKYLTLDITLDANFSCMPSVLAKVRSSWTWDDVKCKQFTAGITNKIYGYYLNSDPKWNDMVLVRLYGENTDKIISRSDERRNMCLLHSAGSGPPLYAALNNALVYGFVQGVTTDQKSIREPIIRDLVAKQMAKLHTIDLTGHPDFQSPEPLVYSKIDSILKAAPLQLSDPEKQKRWAFFGKPVVDLHKEFEFLKQLTVKHGKSPCGFTHNDLLLENVVYSEERRKITFIDYEYGGYNYLYFDVANHFVEHVGVVDPDPNLYPDKAYMKQWLVIYLTEYRKLRGEPNGPDTISDAELEATCDQIGLFSLWSNLLWGIWAIVQAEYSTIPFDYVDFATSRLGAYYRDKEECIAFTKQ